MKGDEIVETPLQSLYKLAALSQRTELNIKLREVQEITFCDPEYQHLKSVILCGFPHTKAELNDSLKPFWSVRRNLAVDDDFIVRGCRLPTP